jgi:hypothetical protein
MKFTIGSDMDIAHSVALKHEFLPCEDAFKEFEQFSTTMIMTAQAQEQAGVPAVASQSRWMAFKTYNAYARFVHHLYEFLLGALARERGDTAKIRAEDVDRWIQANAQRVLTGRRNSILNGTAPTWENHISAFPETVPPEFARELRGVRNKINGHVTHERASKSLTDFYDRYHKFIFMAYWNCLGFWGAHRNDVFPDLQEITDFSVLIAKNVQTAASPHADEEAKQQRSEAIMHDIWRLT